MDFINQILNTVKTSPNPEVYYLAGAVALILVFYLVNKVLKIITFCLIIGVLAFGLSVMQGKGGGEIIASFKEAFDKITTSASGTSSSDNGSYITGTRKQTTSTDDAQSSSGGGMQQLISGMLSKFSGGNR